ncbi:phosphinothricin acetyltransferase [Methanosarcina sp. 2.H.T.1A.6]|uniref:GNAT family N-acetyltransferase n=1 Tax=unclassified Methanosarcina TaxID=2644672 RepID=UPI0006215B5C|nr:MULTISPECIES: GNAT family N-acetyltransferase [unclassified Methanosarcina]KKG14926.1 phosphinothricin acetyltransferase [Methanosarcina sp. 2.H.T.1A.15]KKG15453.1 phosphinothricin acetyltransferase [Methanosarcina sp. 2.H.T.1A.3]KKG24802.1 phosphinothricin acetyltransferase [Methanosarcina sp. 2.H.T.1A.6]KKG26080.1 phosphinothricin acetyltransferase [Methanosarcina sp. 2.H.T.1A.8]
MQGSKYSEKYLIREATAEDISGMLEVFNYYVENSFAAYIETPVGPEFFQAVQSQNEQDGNEHFPFYVIEEMGKIIGLGALRPYFPFPNFRHTGVVSYFILPGHTRKGLGSGMLDKLCTEASKKKMKSLLANVSSKNEASLNFHLKHGFIECGKFREVGTKYGKYFDIVWLQKFLEEDRE